MLWDAGRSFSLHESLLFRTDALHLCSPVHPEVEFEKLARSVIEPAVTILFVPRISLTGATPTKEAYSRLR